MTAIELLPLKTAPVRLSELAGAVFYTKGTPTLCLNLKYRRMANVVLRENINHGLGLVIGALRPLLLGVEHRG